MFDARARLLSRARGEEVPFRRIKDEEVCQMPLNGGGLRRRGLTEVRARNVQQSMTLRTPDSNEGGGTAEALAETHVQAPGKEDLSEALLEEPLLFLRPPTLSLWSWRVRKRDVKGRELRVQGHQR